MAEQNKGKKVVAAAALAAAVTSGAAMAEMPAGAASCEIVPAAKGYGISIRDKQNHEVGHSGVLTHRDAPGGNRGYMLFEGHQRNQKTNTVEDGHYQLLVRKSDGQAACFLNNARATNNPGDSFNKGVKTLPAGPIEDGMKPRSVLERLNLGSQPAAKQTQYPAFGLNMG